MLTFFSVKLKIRGKIMNGEKATDEKVREEVPNVKRQGWSAEEISEEASNQESDEIYRQIARGDETKGDVDERDIVGSSDKNETPHGRHETKHIERSEK